MRSKGTKLENDVRIQGGNINSRLMSDVVRLLKLKSKLEINSRI